MALNFPNVTVLGLDQDSKFFDAGFNYSNSKRLTINGLVTDLTNGFGITGIWTGVDGILNIIKRNNNFDDLVLNGINFGSGRISNFTFATDRDVRTKQYTCEIEVQETGNLFNLTGTYYTGININNWQYLESFSESYAFQKQSNGGYSYNHSANIQFNSGVGNLNAIAAAKILAKSIFTGSALGFVFYSGYTSKFGKRFYDESYNLITNECRFEENFEFDSDSGTYSVVRTNQYEISENGVINVSENGTLAGLSRPTFDAAASALNTELSQAYGRCNNAFAIYAPAGAFPLLTTPLTQSRSFDLFNNNLTYGITFTNDITNSGSYTWDYTQEVTYTDGVAKMTEDGTVQGLAGSRDVAFTNAQAGYQIVKNSAVNRATDFYTNNVGPAFNFLETRSETFAPYQGNIRYNYAFSNESVLVGTNGIKRIEITTDDDRPIYLWGKFPILNNKVIVQDESNETAGQKGVSVNLIGERGVPLSVYLDNAKTQISPEIPTGNDPYINNAQYTFDPVNNTATVSVGWQYNKVAQRLLNVG